MHPTKVGCCLKKRDHRHCRYVVVLFVVIGDGLPHCRHLCHPYRHHHHRNHPITPLPGMHLTKVGCCLKKRDHPHRHRRYVVVPTVVIGDGLPRCCRHRRHSHRRHHHRSHPIPPHPQMHPTKVGCCLKNRDHCHRHYVIVLFVVIGDGLPHRCHHRRHPHRHHHCGNNPPTPLPGMHLIKVGCCLKNEIIVISINVTSSS